MVTEGFLEWLSPFVPTTTAGATVGTAGIIGLSFTGETEFDFACCEVPDAMEEAEGPPVTTGADCFFGAEAAEAYEGPFETLFALAVVGVEVICES
jgi:hypothetical protein